MGRTPGRIERIDRGEGRRILASDRHPAPAALQADEGLATEQAPALLLRTVGRAVARFEHEQGLVAATEIFVALQAPARAIQFGVADALEGVAVGPLADQVQVDQAVDRDVALGERGRGGKGGGDGRNGESRLHGMLLDGFFGMSPGSGMRPGRGAFQDNRLSDAFRPREGGDDRVAAIRYG